MPPQTENQVVPEAPKKPIRLLILTAIMIVMGLLSLWYLSCQKDRTPDLVSNQNLVASSTPEMTDWKTYRNEEYGFEFEYPKELIISSSDTSNGVGFGNGEFNSFVINYENILPDESVDGWISKRQFVKSESVKLFVDGRIIWKWFEGYDEHIRPTNLSLFLDSKVVTFTIAESSMFDQILSTFKFISTTTGPTIYDDTQKLEYGYNLKRYKALFGTLDYTNADIVWIDKDGKETLILKNIKKALPELQESPLIGLSKLSYPENSNKLYFYTYRDSSDGPPMDVYEFNLDTKKFNKRPVATEYYSNFGTRSVSLNGKFIATTENPKDGSDNKSIFLINLQTDTVKKIVTVGKDESTSYCSKEGDCWGYHTHNLKWIDDWTLEYDVYDTTKLVGNEYVKDHPLLEKRKVIIQ